MTNTPRSRDDVTVSTGAAAVPVERRLATWAWVAVVVAIVDTTALAIAGIVTATNHISTHIADDGAWINIVAGPTFPLLAALMVRDRRPDAPRRQDRLAWLFLGLGVLCTLTGVVFTYVAYGLRSDLPLIAAASWVENWLWTGVVPGVALVLLWFPTGEPPGRRWRAVPYGLGICWFALWLSAAFYPGHLSDFSGHHDNPLGWRAGRQMLDGVAAAGHVLLAVTFLAAVASLFARFRQGDAQVRRQLRWLLVAVLVITVTVVMPSPSSIRDVVEGLNVLATVMLPVTLAVTLVRRDDLALPRLLVYGLLSTLLLVAYVAVVGIADQAFGQRADRTATLVAAGLIAVLVAPLRARLQRSVDRLIYGDRGDPYAALTDLGRRITGTPDDLLDEVVRTVADALRAPYVAVVLAGDDAPAASVGRGTAQLRMPLVLRGEKVGSLDVAQRTAREPYGTKDLALLDELARHIAVTAHAVALTRDLQRSRESLVVAREEERRRIRRDLHDGLGPALAGVAFGIDAARNTLARNPDATASALAQLKSEVQASIGDVRRLVYDLRPPALDQLGLVPAVEEYAARLGERGALDVSVSAAVMPTLPAAVEVAAYRIATEALNNAARHSGARRTDVVFEVVDGQLRLEVHDDGVGIPTQSDGRSDGVGLAAMVERAEELGGRCEVSGRTGGGTAVVALLPLAAAS
jgi:signal transduction histidine kinase